MAPMTFPEPTTFLHRMDTLIQDRLRLAFPVAQFEIANASPIPSKVEWDRLFARKPAIGVAFSGIQPDKRSGRMLQATANWIIYLVAANQQIKARFCGDDRGIGMFGMVTGAVAVLHGVTINDVGTTAVESVETLTKEDWGDEQTAIVGIALSVPYMPDAGAASVELEDFLQLNCAWLANGAEGPDDSITVRS